MLWFTFALLCASVEAREPASSLDVLVVTDRSISMFRYNQSSFYNDILEYKSTWGNDFRVGVISCGNEPLTNSWYLTNLDFSLTAFHQQVMKLDSADEDCFTAINHFLTSGYNFRREHTPLSVIIFSDRYNAIGARTNYSW